LALFFFVEITKTRSKVGSKQQMVLTPGGICMKLNKVISMLAVLAFANVAAAEQDGFKISGDFASSIFNESGDRGNGAYPSTGAIGVTTTTGTAGNSDSFSIDQAELNIEKAVGNSSIVMGIGYGRIFDHINYTVDPTTSAPKSTLNLTNAYFAHKVGDTGLSFRLGKFATFFGHETYKYMDNMNYTRGYAFNYVQPQFLTGLNVNYSLNDMIDGGLYVVNTTANSDIATNENLSYGANVNIRPMEGMSVRLNYLTGKEGTNSGTLAALGRATATYYNAIVAYNHEAMDFAVQYSAKDSSGDDTTADMKSNVIGLYAGYKQDVWGFGARYEMTKADKSNNLGYNFPGSTLILAGEDNKINAVTLSGWYDVDANARVKLEVAQHSSDKKVFVDDKGAADDKMMVYGLGFAYRF
jgi:hypothetical protein